MSKKIAGLIIIVSLFQFFGCASTQPAPDNIMYKEFSFNECNYTYKFEPLVRRGYRGIVISDAKLKNTKGNNIVMGDLIINADDYMRNTPDLKERIEDNRIYKVYLYGLVSGDFVLGYDITPQLMKIDGLRTYEEIENERITTRKVLDSKGRSLSEKYIYHGIEESTENAKLFEIGALEVGHAYFISSFAVSQNGNGGGIFTNRYSDTNFRNVSYFNQKVRAEVVTSAELSAFTLPINVIIVGGESPEYIPIILGVVK